MIQKSGLFWAFFPKLVVKELKTLEINKSTRCILEQTTNLALNFAIKNIKTNDCKARQGGTHL
jgi:hypothetical protein